MNKKYLIKFNSEYLDTYGPTREECSWTTNRETAFQMSKESAAKRVKVVQEFWPDAEIVEV